MIKWWWNYPPWQTERSDAGGAKVEIVSLLMLQILDKYDWIGLDWKKETVACANL